RGAQEIHRQAQSRGDSCTFQINKGGIPESSVQQAGDGAAMHIAFAVLKLRPERKVHFDQLDVRAHDLDSEEVGKWWNIETHKRHETGLLPSITKHVNAVLRTVAGRWQASPASNATERPNSELLNVSEMGTNRRYSFNSGRSAKSSSASGLASASLFLTGRPWTTSRTASSTILPDLVRGMSATWTIFAGTCRGD